MCSSTGDFCVPLGFNRYMVECEFLSGIRRMGKYMCFNRYMVECEYITLLLFPPPPDGFNRYMVECE